MKRPQVVFICIFLVLAILVCVYLVFAIGLGASQTNNKETLLLSSTSPDGEYTVEAYRTEPGATVDFSVKVYLITLREKVLIYNAYHEYSAEIMWVDNETISINGKVLNLSQNDKYDWRQN